MMQAFKKLCMALSMAILALGGMAGASAQTKPKLKDPGIDKPASAIFIGNSFFYYNNSMHGHLDRMVNATEPKLVPRFRATSVTISGSGLNWHDVDAYFKPGGMASYSFGANNVVTFNKLYKLFDVAIMMDCSQCPIHPTLQPIFHEYVKKDSDIVRKHGAKPVLFMSWAYADKPEMTAQLAEQYTLAGNANDAFVIPAGLAFARSIAKRPELNLYVEDKRHPSLPGTYLAAATIYGALFGRSPVGNSYVAGLDADTARFLQTVAWETVQDYYQKKD
ncbi:hypothetical protein EGT07_04675 [Herbaspirillum sp. HC18]|nr:hypothetical protein EGT07_04675 [Herbaspirillum sp. HC18]